VAAEEAPAKVQTLVAHRQSGLLFGLVSTNPKVRPQAPASWGDVEATFVTRPAALHSARRFQVPGPGAIAELRTALAAVAAQFVQDHLAALEPLRPSMRTYRNDDDDKVRGEPMPNEVMDRRLR